MTLHLTRPRSHRRSEADAASTPFGPDAVVVHPRTLELGEGWCRTLIVTGYPREVGLGWLEPLATHPGRLDVALHVAPLPASVAADRLRRQLARLESGRRSDAAKGRLADPEVEVALDDARDLASGLARGEQHLFRVALVLTVHAPSEEALTAECTRVRALASSLLLDAQPTTFRQLQGWVSTLPFGINALDATRTFDTAALSAAYPFASAELAASEGVLYGTTVNGAGLVCWDRFACDNYNSVILARSGAGKSYLTKIETVRSLYRGIDVAVVDPEDEYRRLAEAVGGTYVHLGATGVRINPFDLPVERGRKEASAAETDQAGDDVLSRQALFLHGLIAVLLGEPLDATAKPALDRAILAAYASVGITSDPRTHRRPAPLLADLAAALMADTDEAGHSLARRLEPFTTGSHRGLFDGPTTTRPEGHLVVFSLRDLPDELKAVGTMLTLASIWRRVIDPNVHRRNIVVVEEAWLLMREPEGARFLFRMAKSARKYWCGLTVVTQDAADLLDTSLGQAIVANSATQILLRQAPQAIDALGDAFRLSDGERAFLLGAQRGEGLLAAGSDRVAFRCLASSTEHHWCTSDPAELAADEPDL